MTKSKIIVALAVCVLLGNISFGMYDAKTGRFMQRDPIGTAPRIVHTDQGPKVVGTQGPVVPNPASEGSQTSIIAMNSAEPESKELKSEEHHQYIDGLNLYQYVASNPIVLIDPSGLKVYACVRQSLNAHEKPGSDKKIKVPHWYIKSDANPTGCGLAGYYNDNGDHLTKVSSQYGELADKDKDCIDVTYWVNEECINKYLGNGCQEAQKKWGGRKYGHGPFRMDCHDFANSLVLKCRNCKARLSGMGYFLPSGARFWETIGEDSEDEEDEK